MLMVGVATCCAAQRALAHGGGYSEHYEYVHACTCNVFFTANGSRRLEVSRTRLSYKGRPGGLKASDETALRYFGSFFFYKPQRHV